MLKRLHYMILRMLPGPFLGWLAVIMFLLLMQFLMKYLPDIAGKGLPVGVVFELIAYNLAYMLVLAVPMAVLISNLMVFGRLTETRAYAVIKSSGISYMQLAWPTLVLGVLLSGGMMYFNNVVLPESNFRARNLWQDIRKKKPAFDLQAGAFYQGLSRYSILVQQVDPDDDLLHDVTIFDYTGSNRAQSVIKAARGRVISDDYAPFVDLILEDGELHQVKSAIIGDRPERYERLAFERYRFRLDLSDFVFERSDPTQGFRSDRTMRTDEMMRLLDSLNVHLGDVRHRLIQTEMHLAAADVGDDVETAFDTPLARASLLDEVRPGVTPGETRLEVMESALRSARMRRGSIDDARRTLRFDQDRANRYRVEIHKKFSIAVACLIFSLAGSALGVSVRRGGLGMSGAIATAIFLFYWLTLVQGEKFSDRGYVEPWVGMWIANLVVLVIGIAAFIYATMDLRGTPRLSKRLTTGLRS